MGKKNRDIDKIIDSLNLFDDELMSRVFDENNEATEYLINTILGRDDIHVKSSKGQYSMKSPKVGGHSITLDVKAESFDGKAFNVEVQNNADGAHVKRARYHSSMIDSRMLKEKEPYSKLRDSYVIFIYKRDKFRQGLPVYHIERYVEETGNKFGDGSHIIYVNGRYEGNDALGRLIHDFKCVNSKDVYNKALADSIRHYKETKEGREEMSEKVEKYGDKRERQGEKRGEKNMRVKAVRSLMESMKWTVEQALDALMIDGKERKSIIKVIQG